MVVIKEGHLLDMKADVNWMGKLDCQMLKWVMKSASLFHRIVLQYMFFFCQWMHDKIRPLSGVWIVFWPQRLAFTFFIIIIFFFSGPAPLAWFMGHEQCKYVNEQYFHL